MNFMESVRRFAYSEAKRRYLAMGYPMWEAEQKAKTAIKRLKPTKNAKGKDGKPNPKYPGKPGYYYVPTEENIKLAKAKETKLKSSPKKSSMKAASVDASSPVISRARGKKGIKVRASVKKSSPKKVSKKAKSKFSGEFEKGASRYAQSTPMEKILNMKPDKKAKLYAGISGRLSRLYNKSIPNREKFISKYAHKDESGAWISNKTNKPVKNKKLKGMISVLDSKRNEFNQLREIHKGLKSDLKKRGYSTKWSKAESIADGYRWQITRDGLIVPLY